MDWRLFLSVFVAVFVAEIADKTQLVSIGISSKTGKPLFVWFASVAAYMVITALSVILGSMLGKYIKPELIRYGGAIIFICIGLLILFNKI